MSKETKYGVISDIHEDPRIIVPALQVLQSEGIEKLLVNGDIGSWKGDLKSSQSYTAFILDQIGKTGLETFVQPGSHEPIIVYKPVIDALSSKYKNIIDAVKTQKIDQKDHSLVFLPGSDFICGGEYQIGNEKLKTGSYIKTNRELIPFKTINDYLIIMQKNEGNAFHYSQMQDLKRQVTDPDKTIVVCHIPKRFNNLETCVDVAEFGEATEDFELEGRKIQKSSIFPIQSATQIVQSGYPVKIKKENRGNVDLGKIYDELGIKKQVSGHFHESSHRATDSQGNPVPAEKFIKELFWNSGHLDKGYTGILTVKENEIKYQNINLRDYLS